MLLRTGPRLTLLFVAFGFALAAPRASFACSAPKGDFDHNGTTDIKLIGDTAKQNAIIELHSGGYDIKIDCDANGNYTGPNDVHVTGTDEIETYIIALGGNDTVTVLQTADMSGVSKNVVATLIGGTNKLTFKSQGFAINGNSNLVFEVGGAAGADTFVLDFSGSDVSQSLILARGILGSGANNGSVVGPAHLTDSVLDVNVDLGLGNTNGAYADGGGLVSHSTVNVHFFGGDVATAGDTVTTTFSGKLEDHSRLYLDFLGQQGNDKYFGHFDLSTFSIDAAGTGDSEAIVAVDMGNGFDIYKVDDMSTTGPATINGVLVHDVTTGQQPDATQFLWHGLTGSGLFAVREDGGWANDKLNMTLEVDGSSSNTLYILADGAHEQDISLLVADALNITVDAPASVTYGALGGIVVDGGMQGDDTAMVAGTATFVVINCEKGNYF